MFEANVSYSRGFISNMNDVVSCLEYSDGRLHVKTEEGKHYIFKNMLTNHWVLEGEYEALRKGEG